MRSKIRISADELSQVRMNQDTLDSAVEGYLEHGMLLVENVFPQKIIEGLRTAFVERYGALSEDELQGRFLQVGEKRYMVPVVLEGVFNDPILYGNPFVLQLLNRLLGSNYVLNSLGSVIALPGSKNQHIHLDHPYLFEEHPDVSQKIPPYAVTVIIPYADVSARTGTTRIWPFVREDQALNTTPSELLETKSGSVCFMDYRAWHGGTANRTKHPRTIMYGVYSRPWFKDAVNFSLYPPLVTTEEELARVPEMYRFLFASGMSHPRGSQHQRQRPEEERGA